MKIKKSKLPLSEYNSSSNLDSLNSEKIRGGKYNDDIVNGPDPRPKDK